LSNFKDVAIV